MVWNEGKACMDGSDGLTHASDAIGGVYTQSSVHIRANMRLLQMLSIPFNEPAEGR